MSNDTSRNGRGGSSRAGPAVPALLLDLDGVIYGEDRAIKGADEAVRWIQEQAIPHRFVTNTSSVPRAAIVAKLNELGIAVHEEAIVSPPAAAARWLEKNVDGPVALFVSEKTKAEFGSCALLDEEAESGSSAVVIGYLGDDWTFAALNRAFRLLVGHPKPSLLAMGMTRYWSASSGLTLDVGPFVRALEYAAGVEAVVLGKPSKAFFDSALSGLNASGSSVWMIGDDIEADIGGAQAAGLNGALVRTGKFRVSDLDHEIQPDAVLDSIADLPAWWSSSPSG